MVLLLIAAMLAPLAESFDRWDAAQSLTSDSEFPVAALALTLGLCAVVALVLGRLLRAVQSMVRLDLPVSSPACAPARYVPCTSGSPPTVLQLRI